MLGKVTAINKMVINKRQQNLSGSWQEIHPNFIDVSKKTITINNQTSFSEFTATDSLATLALPAPLPDLVINSQTVNPGIIGAGQDISANFIEANQGSVVAGPHKVSFYLSTDNILTPGSNSDILLGQYNITSPINNNANTGALSKTLTIPCSVAGGNYTLFFVADGLNEVFEANENNNAASVAITINAVVSPGITISPSPVVTACSGQTITFTANVVNGNGTPVYQWYLNGNPVGSNSSSYTTPLLNADAQVYCNLISNAVCANPGGVNSPVTMITVNQSVTPSLSITITSGINPGCIGQSLTFTATPTNGGANPVYQWKIGSSNVGSNSSTYTTSSLTNGQIVSCVMTTNSPCASSTTATSNSITITVNNTVTPLVSIAVTSGNNPACAGQSLTFTASPTNGGANPVYQWKVGISNVGSNSPIYSTSSLTNGQVVSCTMTSDLPCVNPVSIASNAVTMTVNTAITPTISIAQTACSGNTVTFNSTITNGGSSPAYQWLLNTILSGTGPGFTLNNAVDGNQVQCILTSNASCVNPQQASSNILTVNCVATGLPTINGVEEFKIISNPNAGRFSVKIKLNTMKDVSFKMYDLSGHIVYQSEIYHWYGAQTKEISESKLGDGVYLLESRIGKEKIIEKVVIVR